MDPALEKLRAALEEYLAQGGDTPVAPEAQALMDAISGADPGAADMGAPPMDAGGQLPPDPMQGGAPMDAGPPLPPMDIPPSGDMPPAQPDAKTFEGARAGAKDRLKKLNKGSKA